MSASSSSTCSIDRVYLVMRRYECGIAIVEAATLTNDRALLELARVASLYYKANPESTLDIRDNVFYFDGVVFRVEPVVVTH